MDDLGHVALLGRGATANVRIINGYAFSNPRVDIEQLQPIEWNLKPLRRKKR